MCAEKSWPDCTFTWESEDQKHYPGSHLEPFYENTDHLLAGLPEMLNDAWPSSAFGDIYPGPHEIPAEWAKGAHLCWPYPNRGLIMTLRIGEKDNEVTNLGLCPFFCDGTQISIDIQKVFVWASGMEAQIEGCWNESIVTFFDIAFLNNRGWYEAGKRLDFILSGIAYRAGLPEVRKLALKPDSALAKWQQSMAEQGDEPKPEIRLEGATIFMPLSKGDRDDYWFRGPVRRVTAFDDWLGQSGWRVRVTVMRFDDEDADLDVYVTRRAWSASEPPEVGRDIEGRLWLQGQLWSAM